MLSNHKQLDEMKRILEEKLDQIKDWLEEKELDLATVKTEIMPMNKKHIQENFKIRIGPDLVQPKKSIKYLGVFLDRTNRFHEHIKFVTNKAIKTVSALAKIMPNTLNLRQGNKTLYYRISESIVLYAAPTWADKSGTAPNRKLLNTAQNLGLSRIAAAYRSVPLDTLAVLTGCVPWFIKAKERKAQRTWEKFIDNWLRDEVEASGMGQHSASSSSRRTQPSRRTRPVEFYQTNREDRFNRIRYREPSEEGILSFIEELVGRGLPVNTKNMRTTSRRFLDNETTTIW